MTRRLIVNADDFGQTHGINRGVIRAYEEGIVTSASLMVRWDAAEGAAQYARANPSLSVGLHIDLGEWVYEEGEWSALYDVVDTDDADAVAEETAAQLEQFQKLVGRDPTHLDAHQHVHRRQPVRRVAMRMGRQLGVPVRRFGDAISYSGAFYGMTRKGEPYHDAITQQALVAVIRDLPVGTTELGCHPGQDDGTDLVYRTEREQELSVLCADTVKETLRQCDVELASFHDISRATGAVGAIKQT